MALHPQVVDVRRHLHAHPELSNHEKETAATICKWLDDEGIPYQKDIGGFGIVGSIAGKESTSKTIALRADMDALPIAELNNVPYKSTREGVMHACGHDVHMASLLGASRILNKMKDRFAGTVKLIFQPAEEKVPGGALRMINEGILNDQSLRSIIGQHVHPPLEAGKVGFKKGAYMASADEIFIRIKGKGGHAALPGDFIDPVLIAAQLLVALQQVVSRMADPHTPSVLSFGKIIANGSTNVIPDEVWIEGTFRTFDEKWRFEAHRQITDLSTNLCKSMGGQVDVDIHVGYPFLYNDPTLTQTCRKNAIEFLGKENVVELPPRMTAEDFAHYAQVIPGCFYRLGTGNKSKNITSSIHTATFDIDEDALLTGMGLMAWLAASQLQ